MTTPDDICDAVHDHADKCDGCRAKALEEAAGLVEAKTPDKAMGTWLAAEIRKSSPVKPPTISFDSLMNDLYLSLRVVEHEHKRVLTDGKHAPGGDWKNCPTCRAVYNADEALSMLREGFHQGRAAFQTLERWIGKEGS